MGPHPGLSAQSGQRDLGVLHSVLGPGISRAHLDTIYLASFGRLLAPLEELLSLDWPLLVALPASFIAKENAIAALGILYGNGPEGAGLTDTLAAFVPTASALSFLTATMLFIPCVATLAVMRKETGR